MILLLFFLSIIIRRPLEQNDRNEVKKVGTHILISTFLVLFFSAIFRGRLDQEILYIIENVIIAFVLYKLFANVLTVINNLAVKTILSIEEFLGLSVFLVLSISIFGKFEIYGFSIARILTAFLVMWTGLRNGILVGVVSGLLLGLVSGVINPISLPAILTFEIAGIIGGILRRFGRYHRNATSAFIIIGNILLAILLRKNLDVFIRCEEVLIGSIGLLALPKRFGIRIEDFFKNNTRALSIYKSLDENKEAVEEAIRKMKEEEQRKIEEEKKKLNLEEIATTKELFIERFKIAIMNKRENILYEYLGEDENLLEDVYKILESKTIIKYKELIAILANHKIYISDSSKMEAEEMVRVLNSAYRKSNVEIRLKDKK